ncbi:MAG TPA: hypothetical protein VJ255_10195, partial [Candidatus Acidoferrum sp.]|nr:hypothetical protein [Candidatus Acidoferrum sp.]
SFCSRLHPVAGAWQKSDGHCLTSFVVLQGDHCGFRPTPVTIPNHPDTFIELHRQGGKENGVF